MRNQRRARRSIGLGVMLLGLVAALPAMVGQGASGDPAIIREFGGTRAFTRPSRDAVMGFSLATQIMEVVAKGGQEVQKGQVLVRGDDAEDQALLKLQKIRAETDLPVKRAKATLDLADLENKRMIELRDRGGGSPQEFDRARLSLEGATLDYETAKLNQRQEAVQVDRLVARIAKYNLTAPFDGQVDVVHVDAGQAVSENEKVVRVVNIDRMWIDVPAPMTDVVTLGLKATDPAWVLLDVAGKFRMVEGRIIEVSPVADAASRTRRIRVELANPKGPARLVAGEPAWVRFSPPPEGVAKQLAAGAGADPVAAAKK